MSDELKPCPFCGRLPHYMETVPYITCSIDCAGAGSVHTKDEWNHRPIEDNLRKQLDIAKVAIGHVLKHPLTRYHEVEEYWMITILEDALAEIEKIGVE